MPEEPKITSRKIIAYLRRDKHDNTVVTSARVPRAVEMLPLETAFDEIMEETGNKPVLVQISIQNAPSPEDAARVCQGPAGPYCRTLNDRMAALANDRSKGISQSVIHDFSTGEESAIGVYYKTGPGDQGLFLNLCPWCGASIAPQKKKK